MAAQPTAQPILLEEYLRTSYERECEYLDGVLVEKPMPTFDHGRMQTVIGAIFELHRHEWGGVMASSEARTEISKTRVRVPDIVIVPADYDRRPLVHDPLLTIEILSPDDTVRGMEQRWGDALAAGAKEVWIFDPEGSIYIADQSGLHQVPAETPELTLDQIRFNLSEMWTMLRR